MNTPTDLSVLAERLENATGPDRELDVAIWLTLCGPADREAYEDGLEIGADEARFRADYMMDGKSFTASLDAALTLVPEGWPLRVMNFSAPCADDRKWHLNVFGGSEGQDGFVGRGATPALALCAAALRGRGAA